MNCLSVLSEINLDSLHIRKMFLIFVKAVNPVTSDHNKTERIQDITMIFHVLNGMKVSLFVFKVTKEK